jgi:hypothetical protein
MPGKSRHGKGKRYHYSKKSKALRRQEAAGVPAPTVNTSQASQAPGQPAPTPAAPAPKAAAAPSTQVAENTYSYIGGELRRIAILAGIIIAILIVLSFVLK